MSSTSSSQSPGAEVPYDRKRLLIASCLAIAATAMTFSIRSDTLKAFGLDFQLTHQQEGYINLLGIWGFPIAILLVGPLCDTIGMGLLLRLAAVGHILGVVLTILSPSLGFPVLLLASLIFGLANGTVEAVTNPLVATMYKDDKTAKLNLLHAFWPGGLIIGGLLAYGISQAMGIPPEPVVGDATTLSWKLKWAAVIVAAVVYLVLTLGQKFPPTERVESGVSNKEMLQAASSPMFLIFMFCMCLTAITELGPDQWVGSVLTDTVGIQGILFLVYTSGLMFVLRVFAGKFIHALSPMGMLLGAAVLSCVGLLALSYSFSAGAALLAATIFGFGKAFFWPTMLGVANEQHPRTGALGLAMMGAAGMIAAGFAGPVMGRIYDQGIVAALPADMVDMVTTDGAFDAAKSVEVLKVNPGLAEPIKFAKAQGAARSFRVVAILPALLVLVFGLLFVSVRKSGGYQTAGMHDGHAANAPPGAEV